MSNARALGRRPVVAALVGGTMAVGLAIAVMLAEGGAQAIFYALVNAAALTVGLIFAALLMLVPFRAERWLAVAAALSLLATALWGADLEGIRRWVPLPGNLRVQPAFLLLPLLLCMYARRSAGPWHMAACLIAAIAVALQPDRSMAFAITAVALAIWFADRTRAAAMVLCSAVAAVAVTLWRSDPLTGVAHVEHVLEAGWRSGLLAGSLLTLGGLAMLAPLITTRRVAAEQQRAIIAFSLCWGSLLAASIIAPYPTPLLGYGPSAIIGYFVSIIALRTATRAPERP